MKLIIVRRILCWFFGHKFIEHMPVYFARDGKPYVETFTCVRCRKGIESHYELPEIAEMVKIHMEHMHDQET
jgi:hypothetical protein